MRGLALAAFALALACTPAVQAADAIPTLRVAMLSDVETLDPARAPDTGTAYTLAPLFHQLLTYAYGSQEVKLIPYAAATLPQISGDLRTYTFNLRRGLLFAPHAAFGDKPRELVAEDFVYSWKRLADPANSSMSFYALDGLIEGLDDTVRRARREAKPFDYAATITGLRATDRYTLQIRLTRPDAGFIYNLAFGGLSAVPREVVDADGPEFARKPVGSGPYQVARFLPGTRLDVVRNPNYKALPWTFFAPTVPVDSPLAKAMRGRNVPMVERVEMLRIPESSTALLSLLRGEIDMVAYARAPLVYDGTALKASLRDAGIRAERAPDNGMHLLEFNMRDASIGGFAPEQVALRRAIAMSIDDAAWLRTFSQDVGTVRQHMVAPGVAGYDPAYRNPNSYNPGTANALLDRMGYKRGADGWRRRPDGGPLELRMINGVTTVSRQQAEFMQRSLSAVGLKMDFDSMPGGDRLKRLSNCQFQMTTMGFGDGPPDGAAAMGNFHSQAIGTVNFACYKNDDYDRIYEQLRVMPAGPERAPLFAKLTSLLDAHAPARILPQADEVTLIGPRLQGFRVHPYLPLPYYLLDVAAEGR